MKVGVFFGGVSSEKEVSLESGRHIYNSLDKSKYKVIPIFVDSSLCFWQVPETLLWKNSTSDIEDSLGEAQRIFVDNLKDLIDFAFLGLHGKFVEDGSLQGLLTVLEIPFNGPRILGSAIGMDKIFQKKLFVTYGLNFAPYLVVEESYNFQKLNELIKLNLGGYPVIVKPSREGCSTGLSKVNNEAEISNALEDALKWDNRVLVEKFLPFMEVTCTILGNEDPYALTPTETPAKGDFLTLEEKFLPGDAQMITPPRVSNEEVELIKKEFVKAYKALNLSVYSRIDGFWDKKEKKLYINEPNTLPGVTPSTHVFHQAAESNMSPSNFFDKVIELSLYYK